MRYCKNCGAELEEGSVFCNECGYKLNGKPQNNSIFNMYDIEMIEGEEIIKKSEINTACLIVPTILTVFGVIIWIIEMVNLGPYGFVKDGTVYITYSGGSANAYTYVLGLLTASADADKVQRAVFLFGHPRFQVDVGQGIEFVHHDV